MPEPDYEMTEPDYEKIARQYVELWKQMLRVLKGWSEEQTLQWVQSKHPKMLSLEEGRFELILHELPSYWISLLVLPEDLRSRMDFRTKLQWTTEVDRAYVGLDWHKPETEEDFVAFASKVQALLDKYRERLGPGE